MCAHKKRFIGIALMLAGFALICASPFLVQSQRVMWQLRGFGGVYWLEDSDFLGVAYVRWMMVFGGIAYCLIMAGVYVLQRAKKHGRFIAKANCGLHWTRRVRCVSIPAASRAATEAGR